MTSPAVRQLLTAMRRALTDPEINTSAKRAERLRTTVSTLERAAADLPPEALRSLAALFRNDVLGHPDHPDTVLGRIAAGDYRTRPAPHISVPAVPHGRHRRPLSAYGPKPPRLRLMTQPCSKGGTGRF
ncbi:hypothetical protein [Streptomyces sp. NPDC058739]|uniref:hypothetical protein n=1 Tax=Streptomyces sp. NPDC058739 TaxID=3346618 RepID=UPI0036B90E89